MLVKNIWCPSFEPRNENHLTVEVSFSSPNGRLFGDSLARGIDEVRVGLPDEYTGGVFDGIDLAKAHYGQKTRPIIVAALSQNALPCLSR